MTVVHERDVMVSTGGTGGETQHRIFAALYEWMNQITLGRKALDPFRKETAGRAQGVVLEVGAGTGENFAYYVPERVERVEAVEPDKAMRRYAVSRAVHAPVPVKLTAAAVESLPFADASFDAVVATLVFCSVQDPRAGFREIFRVLKPGGDLLLVEHVRSEQPVEARLQGALVPVTTVLCGNCHWNRDTAQYVRDTGFKVVSLDRRFGGMHPIILLHATRPATLG